MTYVWCWAEHPWLEITAMGDSEHFYVCTACNAAKRRPRRITP